VLGLPSEQNRANTPRVRANLPIWLAAALSGGAALSYEICWTRSVVVPVGNSTDAAALVLAGFMIGIAVGARLGGELAEKVLSPLRMFATVELLLGLYALGAARLLAQLSSIPASLGAIDGVALGTALRYVAAALVVALPCLAMGASLPLLVRALVQPRRALSHTIGIAYGANTLGAAVGAFTTGFWAIAQFGVAQASSMAAMGSLGAAALALLATVLRPEDPSGRRPPDSDPRCPSDRPQQAVPLLGNTSRRLALLVTLISGFCMLASEVLWSRMLTFVFGHDTYAWASLLAIVLLGLALGGLVHRLVAGRDPARVTAALLGLFSLALPLSLWVAASLVTRMGRDIWGLQGFHPLATSVWIELYRELLYTPILVLVPCILAGALFAAACQLHASNSHDSARSVGVVGLVNGVGSALGALTAAWGLVSLAGLQAAFTALSLLSAAGSSLALSVRIPADRATAAGDSGLGGHARRHSHSARRGPLVAAPLVAAALVAWVMPGDLPRAMLLKIVGERHQTLLYYEEARTSTVSVIHNQINAEKQLLINAVNEVTTRLVHDQSFKLLGHLGPLVHPHPRSALMICLGAGLSAGAALTHPLERLDVVDLSSAVPRAARYFGEQNHGAVDNPVLHLHLGDGRQYLLNSAGGYDVAIIDSTHPKAADSWILYTREFYELLADRLGEGGIAVQWLPLHGLSEREFKILVRTFQSAFPQMTLWANAGVETYGPVAYAKMVGVKNAPLIVDFGLLSGRLAEPEVRNDLGPLAMSSPRDILDLFLAGPEAIQGWTEGLPIQTDDHPIVAYTTRFSSGRRMQPEHLLAVRSPITPLLRNLGNDQPAILADLARAYEAQGLVLAGMLSRAAEQQPVSDKMGMYVTQSLTTLDYYSRLATLYPRDVRTLFEAATQLGNLGFAQQALPIYQQALQLRPSDDGLRMNQALALLDVGESDAAVARLAQLRSEKPGSAIVLHNLGAALLACGDPSAAAAHLKEAVAWEPESLGARLALADALLQQGDWDRAQAELMEVLGRNSWVAEAHDLLGLTLAGRGDLQGAGREHARAIQLHPYRASYHYHLARVLQARHELGGAEQAYLAALHLDPKYAVATNGLGEVYALQAQFERAADQYVEALQIDPGLAVAAHNLGVALRGQGRTQDAAEAFCLALRLGAPAATVRPLLGGLGAAQTQCGDW
jgi:spermidine synthase